MRLHSALARRHPFRLHALPALLVPALGRRCRSLTVVLFLTIGLNFGIDFKGGTLMELQAKSGTGQCRRRCARRPRASASATWRCRSSAPRAACRCASRSSRAARRRRARWCRRRATRSATITSSAASRRSVRAYPANSSSPAPSASCSRVLACLLYLWFRFERELAVGAIIGTLHDIVLTLGFFVITRHEFNMTSIAAILTIVGYSLNETVVVFDRTRELMRRYKTMPTASF